VKIRALFSSGLLAAAVDQDVGKEIAERGRVIGAAHREIEPLEAATALLR
jgi:hypothetical protein